MAGIHPGSLVGSRPKNLNDADWQKKKGKIGKMVKTGVGAELKKLDTLIKKINSMDLNPASNPSKTKAILAQKVKLAKAEYAKNVKPMQKQCYVVRDKAQEAEKKLKKIPLGGSATKAAAALAKSADQYGVTCKSLDLDSAIAKVLADIKKKNALSLKFLKPSLAKFVVGSKKFLSDPTEDNWNSNIKQQGRSVSNSVAQLEEYRAQFWSEFVKFKGFDLSTMGLAGDPNFGKKSTVIVKKALVQVQAISKFNP